MPVGHRRAWNRSERKLPWKISMSGPTPSASWREAPSCRQNQEDDHPKIGSALHAMDVLRYNIRQRLFWVDAHGVDGGGTGSSAPVAGPGKPRLSLVSGKFDTAMAESDCTVRTSRHGAAAETGAGLTDFKDMPLRRNKVWRRSDAIGACAAACADVYRAMRRFTRITARLRHGPARPSAWWPDSAVRAASPSKHSGRLTATRRKTVKFQRLEWWAVQGLNLRPLPCEGSALPLS